MSARRFHRFLYLPTIVMLLGRVGIAKKIRRPVVLGVQHMHIQPTQQAACSVRPHTAGHMLAQTSQIILKNTVINTEREWGLPYCHVMSGIMASSTRGSMAVVLWLSKKVERPSTNSPLMSNTISVLFVATCSHRRCWCAPTDADAAHRLLRKAAALEPNTACIARLITILPIFRTSGLRACTGLCPSTKSLYLGRTDKSIEQHVRLTSNIHACSESALSWGPQHRTKTLLCSCLLPNSSWVVIAYSCKKRAFRHELFNRFLFFLKESRFQKHEPIFIWLPSFGHHAAHIIASHGPHS